MSDKPAWARTGYDSNIPAQHSNDLWRFYLPLKQSAEITFLDDDTKPREFEYEGKTYKMELPLLFQEHQLLLNGSWKNWFTCLGKDCPLCAAGEKASDIAVFTIIDHSEWKSNTSGRVYKDQMKLYVVKTNTMTYDLIKEISNDNGGLRGVRVRVKRLGENTSPNVGNNFKELEVYGPDDMVPYQHKVGDKDMEEAKLSDIVLPNYLELFAPKKKEEIAKVIGAVADESEDPVPF